MLCVHNVNLNVIIFLLGGVTITTQSSSNKNTILMFNPEIMEMETVGEMKKFRAYPAVSVVEDTQALCQ